MAAKTLTSVRYPPELLERAERIAKVRNAGRGEKDHRETRSEVLVEAIEIGLRQLEETPAPKHLEPSGSAA